MAKKKGPYQRRRVRVPRGGWMIDDAVVVDHKKLRLVKGTEKLKQQPPHPLLWSSYALEQEEGLKQWYIVCCKSDERFDRRFFGVRLALSYWSLLKSMGCKAALAPCDAEGNAERLILRQAAGGVDE